jgi:hypothetical protein
MPYRDPEARKEFERRIADRRRDWRRARKGQTYLIGKPPLSSSEAGKLRHMKRDERGRWVIQEPRDEEHTHKGRPDAELDRMAAEWLAAR